VVDFAGSVSMDETQAVQVAELPQLASSDPTKQISGMLKVWQIGSAKDASMSLARQARMQGELLRLLQSSTDLSARFYAYSTLTQLKLTEEGYNSLVSLLLTDLRTMTQATTQTVALQTVLLLPDETFRQFIQSLRSELTTACTSEHAPLRLAVTFLCTRILSHDVYLLRSLKLAEYQLLLSDTWNLLMHYLIKDAVLEIFLEVANCIQALCTPVTNIDVNSFPSEQEEYQAAREHWKKHLLEAHSDILSSHDVLQRIRSLPLLSQARLFPLCLCLHEWDIWPITMREAVFQWHWRGHEHREMYRAVWHRLEAVTVTASRREAGNSYYGNGEEAWQLWGDVQWLWAASVPSHPWHEDFSVCLSHGELVTVALRLLPVVEGQKLWLSWCGASSQGWMTILRHVEPVEYLRLTHMVGYACLISLLEEEAWSASSQSYDGHIRSPTALKVTKEKYWKRCHPVSSSLAYAMLSHWIGECHTLFVRSLEGFSTSTRETVPDHEQEQDGRDDPQLMSALYSVGVFLVETVLASLDQPGSSPLVLFVEEVASLLLASVMLIIFPIFLTGMLPEEHLPAIAQSQSRLILAVQQFLVTPRVAAAAPSASHAAFCTFCRLEGVVSSELAGVLIPKLFHWFQTLVGGSSPTSALLLHGESSSDSLATTASGLCTWDLEPSSQWVLEAAVWLCKSGRLSASKSEELQATLQAAFWSHPEMHPSMKDCVSGTLRRMKQAQILSTGGAGGGSAVGGVPFSTSTSGGDTSSLHSVALSQVSSDESKGPRSSKVRHFWRWIQTLVTSLLSASPADQRISSAGSVEHGWKAVIVPVQWGVLWPDFQGQGEKFTSSLAWQYRSQPHSPSPAKTAAEPLTLYRMRLPTKMSLSLVSDPCVVVAEGALTQASKLLEMVVKISNISAFEYPKVQLWLGYSVESLVRTPMMPPLHCEIAPLYDTSSYVHRALLQVHAFASMKVTIRYSVFARCSSESEEENLVQHYTCDTYQLWAFRLLSPLALTPMTFGTLWQQLPFVYQHSSSFKTAASLSLQSLFGDFFAPQDETAVGFGQRFYSGSFASMSWFQDIVLMRVTAIKVAAPFVDLPQGGDLGWTFPGAGKATCSLPEGSVSEQWLTEYCLKTSSAAAYHTIRSEFSQWLSILSNHTAVESSLSLTAPETSGLKLIPWGQTQKTSEKLMREIIKSIRWKGGSANPGSPGLP
jgi:hypothetical protein